ncbi:hypothetical protein AG1IA_01896 [Rhizoctonia solani AG-1 IA]|uniref:Uncharacterized protein n=1 Tax=Thanatephorus cucumeris (strain AG1-IA) TaxID=983506 RepID=L8X156_THACA|nr:hypothetical protein AG1IA_01896 [Rhizoctonia solani AG-1 IA]
MQTKDDYKGTSPNIFRDNHAEGTYGKVRRPNPNNRGISAGARTDFPDPKCDKCSRMPSRKPFQQFRLLSVILTKVRTCG